MKKGVITFKHKGNFINTERFMKKTLRRDYMRILRQYGEKGVEMLAAATPVDTGKTASSWNYKIIDDGATIHITWNNSNDNDGVSVVMLLVYGHGLSNGGYVPGNDFVTPVMKDLLQEMAKKAWREVTK